MLFIAFAGNTAPYHITQPSVDNYVQIVSPTATMASIMCSLNVTITSNNITVSWIHNDTISIPPNEATTTDDTTTLVITDLEPSDAGVYQCVFNDIGNGWELRRNVSLLIAGMFVHTIFIGY